MGKGSAGVLGVRAELFGFVKCASIPAGCAKGEGEIGQHSDTVLWGFEAAKQMAMPDPT